MLIALVLALMVAVIFMGIAIKKFAIRFDDPYNRADFYQFLAIVTVCLVLTHLLAAGLGGGVLREDLYDFSLTRGAVYTVVSSAPIGDGKFAVILKFKNGKILAYELAKDPPKVFIAVDDKENPYVPYPVK